VQTFANNCCCNMNLKATNFCATLSLRIKAGCIISSPKARDSQWNNITKVCQHQRSSRRLLLLTVILTAFWDLIQNSFLPASPLTLSPTLVYCKNGKHVFKDFVLTCSRLPSQHDNARTHMGIETTAPPPWMHYSIVTDS
jgi:hypothetical protein